MLHVRRVFGLAILGLSLAAPVAAQEADPAEEPRPEEIAAEQSGLTAEPTEAAASAATRNSTEQRALASCEEENHLLAGIITNNLSVSCGPLEEQVNTLKRLQADVDRLANKLTTRTEERDNLRAKVIGLANELTTRTEKRDNEMNLRIKAETRVAKLEARLTAFDISVDPGFSYLDDNPRDSFVKSDNESLLQDKIPRLSADRCAEGMKWLLSQKDQKDQTGQDQTARENEIWVWQNKEKKICSLIDKGTGEAGISPPKSRSDYAHIVIFK